MPNTISNNEYYHQDRELSRDFNLMEKSDLEQNFNDENVKTDFVNKQKEKLKNIDLLEKNYEDLYGWKSLLSKTRPLSCYTQSKKKTKENNKNKKEKKEEKNKTEYDMEQNLQESFEKQNDEVLFVREYNDRVSNLNSTIRKKYKHPFRDDVTENEKNTNSSWERCEKKKKEKSDFIFPVALIDETEDKLYEFITIPKNISERRKKMEYFLHIQSQTQKKTGKSNNKINGNRRKETVQRLSVSVNTSNLNHGNFKDEMIQASTSVYNKNKNFNKTFNKSMNNNSRISQSVTKKKKKFNNQNNNMAPRPMSVYAKRSDSAVYYMSKEFSDYFKQDLKEFSEKFSLLHPKIKCDNSKIKKLLEEIKHIQDEDEKLLKNFKIDDKAFDLKDLNLAGNSKNIYPLLKSFLKNYYPEDEVNKFFKDKTYPISNRPIGNKIQGTNLKINVHSKNWEGMRNDKQNKLNIKTYDENDPDLQIFFNNLEDNKNEKNILLEEKEKILIEDQNSNLNKELKDESKLSDYGTKDIAVGNQLSPQSANSGNSNDFIENKKTIGDENGFELIIPKSYIFKEKKITSRPKTAMNKKDFVSKSKTIKMINLIKIYMYFIIFFNILELPDLIVERIAETEENSDISLDKRLTNAKNILIDLPLHEKEKIKNSPFKNLTLKGTSNQHYSYKIMNLNMKNQPNQQIEGGNILKDAIQVKHVHNHIMGINNINSNSNKNQNIIETFTEIKHRKRPTTSKWSSTLSNMSNKLNNQVNSTFMKNENEKNFDKYNKKVNNLYFNNYIDMQFRSNNNLFKNTAYHGSYNNQNKFGGNVSNREESSYYITATKNEKFLNENVLNYEKKNQVYFYIFNFTFKLKFRLKIFRCQTMQRLDVRVPLREKFFQIPSQDFLLIIIQSLIQTILIKILIILIT